MDQYTASHNQSYSVNQNQRNMRVMSKFAQSQQKADEVAQQSSASDASEHIQADSQRLSQLQEKINSSAGVSNRQHASRQVDTKNMYMQALKKQFFHSRLQYQEKLKESN